MNESVPLLFGFAIGYECRLFEGLNDGCTEYHAPCANGDIR